MSKVYMECAWLIFDGFDLDEMLRLSHVLECVIWFRGTKIIYDEGYLLLAVFILADAEEIIKIFCEVVYPYARLIPYRLASLAEFQGESVGLGASLERYRQLMRYWYAHNKRVEKGLPFWAWAEWPVQSIRSETLSAAIKLAEMSGIAIHCSISDHPTQSLTFYFKVSSYHEFHIKLDEIQRILGLEYWVIIRRLLHIEDVEDEDPAFKKEEAMPRFTYDTIPAFLEAIKPYL
jgi:hypothetical protein